MAMGTDMKLLVEDILVLRETRAKALSDIKKDTHHTLSEAKRMLKDFAKENEERATEVKKMAHGVKTFLKSSAENRKADFSATMKTVRASLEDVRKDSKHARQAGKTVIKDARVFLVNIAKDNKKEAEETHAALKKGETHRKADFKTMMEEIQDDIKDVQHDVKKARKDTSDMVSRYRNSRISAQKHWASLSVNRKKLKKRKSEE